MSTEEFDPDVPGAATGYPVTGETPARDDQIAAVTGDAGPEDSPVRTARPDVPIAASMAGGVGEHRPADPDQFGADGRLKHPVAEHPGTETDDDPAGSADAA